jgi:signal transduction histidine kinase
MFPVTYVSVPLEMPEGHGAVVAFSDIEDRLRAERVLREHDAVLASREGSLRRIATLVAGGAASTDVFAAIAREVAQVLGAALVVIWRYEPDRPASVFGAWSDRPHPFQAGTSWPVEEHTAAALLPEVGRPARIEDFGAIGGAIPDAIREAGMGSGTGAAIIVAGEFWGVMGVAVEEGVPLPDHIEDRLAEFTELVATTISNSASRQELARLADEQAALRRVATLVAREASAAEVFAAVAEELGRLLDVVATRMVRYEQDDTATVIASWGRRAHVLPVGTHLPLGGVNVITMVARNGRSARIDDYSEATGTIAAFGRQLDARGVVGTPIVVAGRLWGAMVVSSRQEESLPIGTETSIGEFTDLVAVAISNVQARSDLAASRARIVAATDEERRRVVRDLHDGAQQRLVHTMLLVAQARQALLPNHQPASQFMAEALIQAAAATDELRELAHGLLPEILTHGGLRAAIKALALRAPVPVDVAVSVDRLPAAVEATAYFVVAEALTNVAKHARATGATVQTRIENGTVLVQVRDDGVGGARPEGSGLVGLADRLAVLNGRLRVESPADGGTLVAADIPLRD